MFRLKRFLGGVMVVLALEVLISLAAASCSIEQIVEPDVITVVVNPPPPADTTKTKPDTTNTGPDTTKVVSYVNVIPADPKMKVGDKLTLVTECRDSGHSIIKCPTTIVWTTSVPSVADVAPTGLVTALSPGVTVVCASVSTVIKGCSLITVESVTPTYTIYGVFTSPAQFTVNCGQTQQVNVAVVGNGTVPQTVTWWSSDTTVAKVSSTGLVTGVRNGSALIHAVSTADTTKMQHSYATVIGCTIQSDTTIVLLPENGAEIPLGSSLQTTAVCKVNGVVTPCIKPWWFSREPDKISVDQWTGKLTALKPGTNVEVCVQIAQRQGAPKSCRYFTAK